MPPKKNYRSVYAPDEETALKKAVEEIEIEPKIRNRIVAMRQG
jgi:hypothetical protein